jgi:hypothetical protein
MTNLSLAAWHTSSYSGSGEACVEVAENLPGVVAVRDSKNRDAGVLVFGAAEWRHMTAAVKSGRFDL